MVEQLDDTADASSEVPQVVVRKLAAPRKPKAKAKRKAHTAATAKPGKVKTPARKRAPSVPTSARATKLAISLLEFQKTTLGSGVNLMAKIQDQTEKSIHLVLLRADWMPKEGKKVVEEWMRTVKRSRDEYKKTVDKSFDLLIAYLQRLQREGSMVAAKKPKRKK